MILGSCDVADYPRVPIIWSARSSRTEWVCKKQHSKVQCLGKITRRSRGFSCVTGSAVAQCHFINQAKDLLCTFTNQVPRHSQMTMPNVDKEAIKDGWIQAIDRLNWVSGPRGKFNTSTSCLQHMKLGQRSASILSDVTSSYHYIWYSAGSASTLICFQPTKEWYEILWQI